MSVSDRRSHLPVPCRAAALALACATLAGCGKKGPPVPPEPRGPQAPSPVSVRQIGDAGVVAFDVPPAKGRRPQQQPVSAVLIRVAYPPGPVPPPDREALRRRGEPVAQADLGSLEAGDEVRLTDVTVRDLEGQGVGWTLRYAVQVHDAKGRVSPPATASDLVPLTPASAPENLNAEPTADGIRLSWDPPATLPRPADPEQEPSPPSYHVYRTDPGSPFPARPLTPSPLTERDYLDGTIVAGERYAYCVRVVLAPGRPSREGHPSRTFVIDALDTFAPAAPQGLVAVQEGAAVRLFWDPNREPDLAGYRVYRRVDGGDWQRIGPDPIEQPTYVDREVAAGESLAYRVTAFDRSPAANESEPSGERELIVAPDPTMGDGR